MAGRLRSWAPEMVLVARPRKTPRPPCVPPLAPLLLIAPRPQTGMGHGGRGRIGLLPHSPTESTE